MGNKLSMGTIIPVQVIAVSLKRKSNNVSPIFVGEKNYFTGEVSASR